MAYRTIEELEQITGKSGRTIQRRLKTIKEEKPEEYQKHIKQESANTVGKNRILYADELIPMIGGIGHKVARKLVIDIAAQEVKQASKSALIKPPKIKKKTEVETGQVISLDEMSADQKERLQLFQAVLDQYESGEYTLQECLTSNNMTLKTFYGWINSDQHMNALYEEVYKKHRKNALRSIADGALKQLMQGINGYAVEQSSTTYQEKMSPSGAIVRIPQEHRIHKKHVLPRSDLIMFGLSNLDAETFRRMMASFKDGSQKQADPLEQLTDDQLDEYLNQAKAKGLFLTAGDGRNE